MIQIPDEWAAAIDVEKLGQLAAEHEKGQFTEHGYIVESGDEWEAVTDVPEQYRIMSYPQPEKVEMDAAPAAQAATLTAEPQEPRPVIFIFFHPITFYRSPYALGYDYTFQSVDSNRAYYSAPLFVTFH